MKAYYEYRDKPLQVTYAHNFSFPIHLHSDVEILCVNKGTTGVHIDGRLYTLTDGDIAIMFPNIVHGYDQPPDEQSEILFFIFPPEISMDYGTVMRKRKPADPILHLDKLNPDVKEALRLLLAENDSEADPAVLRAYMQVVLARIMPLMDLHEAKEAGMRGSLYEVLAYLAEHCTEPITLEDLARRFDLSVSYLSHIFSDTIKVNFRSYINALRLLKATEMLKSTDLPVTHICFDCGFESQRTFNRAFREHYGMTPSDFRSGKSN